MRQVQLRQHTNKLLFTAIWDNRSAFHTPTYDYDDLGDRGGNRAVSIAEKPFFGKDFLAGANNHDSLQDKLFADRSFFSFPFFCRSQQQVPS